MSYNLVNPTTGALTRVAGGTLYADLPIGSWVKNDMDTLPSGFLKEGDTISQSECPELYAKYGSTVPYKADTSELSEYEDFSLSTTPATLPYDGFMSVSALTNDGKTLIYLNDQEVARFNVSGSQDPTVSFSFKKGDSIRLENTRSTITNCKVAYYKKSLIVKAKHTPVPVDFMDAVDDMMNDYKMILQYSFNHSSNISTFNRKWLVTGSSIVWTATHTGRLTIRCLKHGDGYSLYLTNQNSVMLDSYDNFFGDETHGLTVSEASITLQAWVKKGDVIELSTNLPASTDWADKYFVQTGLLLYNDNYD
jgi:hypothetical protein